MEIIFSKGLLFSQSFFFLASESTSQTTDEVLYHPVAAGISHRSFFISLFSWEISASLQQIRRCRWVMGHVIGKEGKNEISMCMESYGKAQERDLQQVGKSLCFSRVGYSSYHWLGPRALGSRIPSAGGVTLSEGGQPTPSHGCPGVRLDLAAHPILG